MSYNLSYKDIYNVWVVGDEYTIDLGDHIYATPIIPREDGINAEVRSALTEVDIWFLTPLGATDPELVTGNGQNLWREAVVEGEKREKRGNADEEKEPAAFVVYKYN